MGNRPRCETLTTPGGASGQRLDRWLAQGLPDLSRSAVQRLIREGHVRINGRTETKCAVRLRGGDVLEVDRPAPVPATPRAQPIVLDILFEDNDLLVINKAPGMVVHPAAGNREGTLVNALLHHCRGLSTIGGVERPGIVHRLDKLTSGLMVVAKSDRAHRHLASQLARRVMKRTYLAIVWGQPQPPEGTIDAPIGRHPRDRKRMAVLAPGGRRAVTHYRTVSATRSLALVEASLETGRTHQIRVHLSHRGNPVVGDKQYGVRARALPGRLAELPPALRAEVGAATRQLLHAFRLRFTHPATGESLSLEAGLPNDMRGMVALIKRAGEAGDENRR